MDKIDQAVIDLDGEWVWPSFEGVFLLRCKKDIASYCPGQYAPSSSSAPLYTHWEYICTYPEFMEARKRLENKPTEWPDGSNIMVYSKSQAGWIFGSFKDAKVLTTAWIGHGDGKWLKGIRPGKCFGDWRKSLERRPHPNVLAGSSTAPEPCGSISITQPDHKEGEGVEWEPGVDLPPVGEKCLYNFTDEDSGELWKTGDELEVMAHKDACCAPVAVVWNTRTMSASSRMAKYEGKPMFLPIQSHRDKVIEAAMQVEVFKSDGVFTESPIFAYNVLAELYDEGRLKLPEDDQ